MIWLRLRVLLSAHGHSSQVEGSIKTHTSMLHLCPLLWLLACPVLRVPADSSLPRKGIQGQLLGVLSPHMP